MKITTIQPLPLICIWKTCGDPIFNFHVAWIADVFFRRRRVLNQDDLGKQARARCVHKAERM